MSNSRFAGVATAVEAVARTLPFIEAALSDPAISGRSVLHLVLLDPAAEGLPHLSHPQDFARAVLHEQSVGDTSRWDVDCAALARGKARLSWHHRMDSRRLQWMEPHRLRTDDSLLWGGVWLDGLVVAASGAQPAWDEAFALAVAGCWRGLALQAALAVRDG